MISHSLLQRLQQKLSPQQIQLMKLLQLPTFALEQRIKDEIEKNPTLEEDEHEKTEDSQENTQEEDSNIENDVFVKSNIKIEWFSYQGYIEYPQLWGGFSHEVTILDLLFNCGKDSPHYMKYVRK